MDCGKLTSRGTPCKRQCVPGLTVCNMHGGNSPQAKAKAENMLAQARIPGIEALHEIINQFLEHTCAACGYPTGDSEQQRTVIAAAKVVLDRTQMGPSSTVHVNANGTESDLS